MKLLIDTHILHWWLTDDAKLSEDARQYILNPDNEVFVSHASLWEI
jgi:PIN domain nuclease of toxin-antitoxin system